MHVLSPSPSPSRSPTTHTTVEAAHDAGTQSAHVAQGHLKQNAALCPLCPRLTGPISLWRCLNGGSILIWHGRLCTFPPFSTSRDCVTIVQQAAHDLAQGGLIVHRCICILSGCLVFRYRPFLCIFYLLDRA